VRKKYRQRLAEIRDVLRHLEHERAAFRAYMRDEREALADGSVYTEVYNNVLHAERAKLLESIEKERQKVRRRQQKLDATTKEEVYEKVLSRERAALQRERERLRTAGSILPILDSTERHLQQVSTLIEQQIAAAYEELPKQKTEGFPWLAQAYEDLLNIHASMVAEILMLKEPPAPRAAEAVRATSALRRAAERKAKILEYQLRYYEALFPWLSDLTGEGVDELLVAVRSEDSTVGRDVGQEDAARQWLTDAEYRSLSTTEKYQLALDRYWRGRKTNWQIGRDYERFIGYLYEQRGFSVHYQGIVEGLEDLGRDLIAVKETVQIIQCKRWSSQKEIHEKHINQLFGTMTAYAIDNVHDSREVKGVLYTSTRLSARAKDFAEKLGINAVEGFQLRPYPCVKCNISRRDGSKIYHLPFDQQYDRTLIEQERLERYVETVAEAEALGFRRAFRWRGSTSGNGDAQ